MCDIIIPVYNAFNCLKACFDSVIKYTDLTTNRLILINDKSTDDRVLPLLEEYAEKEGILLLNNETNLGFVATVNKGMKLSDTNDVLLLNSDTEVTKNWLNKIHECAYSYENIATVTPLSNNATMFSVPKTLEANEIPEGYTLETFAQLVEDVSLNSYPEVPTGHGFCMYIKRSALNKVGLFDEKSFGKGYGEENDFCFRCLDVGLINVTCDNTYIYHKESQSFSDKKDNEIKQGLALLEKRYPYYKHNLDVWVQKKALLYICENIELHMCIKNNNYPNILFVIHDWKNIDSNVGGTTLHAWDIIRLLRKHFNFHVLSPDQGFYKVTSYWANSEKNTTVKLNYSESFSINNFYNIKYAKMIEKILNVYNINLVHIHHLVYQYFDIIDICQKHNINVIMTLHDYYTVCPTINKLYAGEYYCEDGSSDKCKACLVNRFETQQRSEKFINAWRETCYKELNKCNLIISPSEAAKSEILKTYSDLSIKVIEHGIDINKEHINYSEHEGNFNVAFIGAIGVHKGSIILEKLIKSSSNSQIDYYLFGFADRELPDNKHFFNCGKYTREQLSELLKDHKIDLVCLFSVWPETYSYTLTEAIACGVPVVAFDFGAIAERIKKYNLGYVIPLTSDVSTIRNELIKISKNKDDYKNKINSINEYKIKTTSEMDSEYQSIYLERISKNNDCIDIEGLKELIDKSSDISDSYNSFDNSYIFNSLKWKIVSRIKVPGFVKKLFRKFVGK